MPSVRLKTNPSLPALVLLRFSLWICTIVFSVSRVSSQHTRPVHSHITFWISFSSSKEIKKKPTGILIRIALNLEGNDIFRLLGVPIREHHICCKFRFFNVFKVLQFFPHRPRISFVPFLDSMYLFLLLEIMF